MNKIEYGAGINWDNPITSLAREQAERIKALETKLATQEEDFAAERTALEAVIKEKEATLRAVLNSKGWRLLNVYRGLKERTRRHILGFPKRMAAAIAVQWNRLAQWISPPKIRLDEDYERWIQVNELANWNRSQIAQEIARFSCTPKISIVMPVYNPPKKYLRRAVKSVRAQLYENWQLCICDDGSSWRTRALLAIWWLTNRRIRVTFSPRNEGISRASNRALRLTTGEFVGFLDHDDQLSPEALYEVVKLLQAHPETDMIYSDEDKVDPQGARKEPFFKPDWSPDYFLSCMYTCHLGVYRKELVDQIGGFRTGFEGSQDYDLVLRLAERTSRIRHIPKVLYHWGVAPGSVAETPGAKPYAYSAAKKALHEHLQRRGYGGEVLDGHCPAHYRIKFNIRATDRVSIIIPTRDRVDRLRSCIESIETKTTYPNYEIIVVDNQSFEESTQAYLSNLRHKVLQFAEPFNSSRLINFGARHADGKYLLLLSNDTEVISEDWIFTLLEFCQQEEIGIAGAKLLLPEGQIQQAGLVLGLSGTAGHLLIGHAETRDYFGQVNCVRNYSAVTAACMMVRKNVFDKVRGFDEAFSLAFSDVDFCLRVRQAGYRIVWTPYAELLHKEAASRAYTPEVTETSLIKERWGDLLGRDPYYNPNLTLEKPTYGLRV